MESLKDQCRTGGELLEHLRGVELVTDLRAEAPRRREQRGREHRPLVGHAGERRPQTTLGDEFVGGIRAEQVVESTFMTGA